MVKAVFFDFYSVWTPDTLSYYLAAAQPMGPKIYKETSDIIEMYFHGQIDVNGLADSLRVKLGHSDLNVNQFRLSESDISPEIINFMRGLHGHFLKLGILANLGAQEYSLLNSFNEHNKLFETISSPLSLQLNEPLLSKEVFSKALGAIGEPVSSCLWVSGNLAYLEFAQSLGMGTVQFEGLAQLEHYLDQVIVRETPE